MTECLLNCLVVLVVARRSVIIVNTDTFALPVGGFSVGFARDRDTIDDLLCVLLAIHEQSAPLWAQYGLSAFACSSHVVCNEEVFVQSNKWSTINVVKTGKNCS